MVLLMACAHAASDPGLHESVVSLAGHPVPLTAVIPIADPTDPTPPLVVALHYAAPHGPPHRATAFVTDLVAPGLASLGAVIVAPDCPAGSWTDPVSEKVVLALVDYAVHTFGADPRRVIVTGYSMGGSGTWFYAARHPDRFAVALPVASDPGVYADQDPLPTYAIQGLRDSLFPAARVEAAVGRLTARGVPAVYRSVDRSHYEVAGYVEALAATVPWLRERLAR